MTRTSIPLIAAILVLFAGPALADQARNEPACNKAEKACLSDCAKRFESQNSGGRIGCESRCSANALQCLAQQTLQDNIPKIRQEADRWKSFMDEFLEGFQGDDPVPLPAPGLGRDKSEDRIEI